MSQTTECTLLAAEFRKATKMMQALAAAPIRMMNTLNGMIMNAALDALHTTDEMFNNIAKNLGLTAIEDTINELSNGLRTLQNCVGAIGNNPLVQSAISTDLASLAHGIGDTANVTSIVGMSRKYAQNLAKKNALASLDKAMCALGLGGQLGNTQMRYAQMLKAAGITDTINLMSSITSCMSSLCPYVDEFAATIDKGLDDLSLNADFSVGDIWKGVDDAKKATISQTVARGQQIEKQINNWAGGLF